ncbi:MAG: hypothetical protein GX483_02340 [Actinomycetaceae bacterium]|nr:hypothetical protein [Actinomycetaceae bacterium]
MNNDAFTRLAARLGVVFAVLAIIMSALAMLFVQVDGELSGPALIPALGALYLIVIAAWSVFLSRTEAKPVALTAMLNHMVTIGFVLITALGVVIWTRQPDTLPAVLGLLVALQGPIAVFLAKRYVERFLAEF